MNKIPVSIRNLGKRYLIGELGKFRAGMLRDKIADSFMGLFKREKKEEIGDKREFWALRDVCFDVLQGQALGIIGRNGAGKSTLLKLISQITEPTEGEICLNGKVASLLEVGTGFHPELTGRENIFMNGSILGMTRIEIIKKFDEIVDFSEVKKFIDTPIKRYSSGMSMRLAFAVAAHLEPEVMLIDEVLAVGDTKFQKKCLGKMDQVATSGKTILFVSHNMGTIKKLCQKCILLDAGRVKMIGETDKVVEAYLSEGEKLDAQKVWETSEAPVKNGARLLSVRLMDAYGNPYSNFKTTEPVFLETKFEVIEDGCDMQTGYHIFRMGSILFSAGDQQYLLEKKGAITLKYRKGIHKVVCKIPGYLLNYGDYTVEAYIVANEGVISTGEILHFKVFNDYPSEWIGQVRPKLEWRIN